MTFETFDQSDEETWPDQQIPTYLYTYPPTHLPTSHIEHPKGAILETFETSNLRPTYLPNKESKSEN